MDNHFLTSLITGIAIGAASGFLGAFMILKRMALVGDALTHVALPGIGIALIFGFNPFLGAFALLFVAMVLIWRLERSTNLPIEAIVGILFAASLAIGILVTPKLELYEALFGDIAAVSLWDGIFALAASLGVFAAMGVVYNKMLMGIISEDLAVSNGIKISKLNFLFLMLVALIVALGVKVVGTLLMGALVIIPAAAAKNIGRSFKQFAFWGSFFGLISSGIGILVAEKLAISPGPSVVLTGSAIFLITLIFKRRSWQ